MLYEVGIGRRPSFASTAMKSEDTDGDGVTDRAAVDSEAVGPAWAQAMVKRAQLAWDGLRSPNVARTNAQRAALAGRQSNALVGEQDLMDWRAKVRANDRTPPAPFNTAEGWLDLGRGGKSYLKLDAVERAFYERVTDRKTPWDSTSRAPTVYEATQPEQGPVTIPPDLFGRSGSSAPPWLPVALGAGAVGLVIAAAAWKRSRKGRR